MNTLNHIGIIMDGNRRWAKAGGLSSYRGHDRGADVFIDTCDWCIQYGIGYLTVYAFSTENWKRSTEEVAHIFKLLDSFFVAKIGLCIEKDIHIQVIGERSKFSRGTLSVIRDAEERTMHCEKLHVQIALSYGGRDEIVRAARKIANDVVSGKIAVDDITEELFSVYLDTVGVPDVDLVIRTGGYDNRRLSNFLPWQTAYSELFFSDLLWPDFSHKEFERAVEYYNSIPRKLGK